MIVVMSCIKLFIVTFHSLRNIGPISFKDWMWDTEKLVQLLFSKYSHIDILRHVTSRFVGRAFNWWQRGNI